MSDPKISMDDATRLKRMINDCADLLIEEGFAAVHIGTVMAAVGAAMVKASGGDVDKVVEDLRQAVADDRKSNLQ
ncbi:hypothetical protein SAMN05216374_0992 [Tardiphaga sp. OK246]|nr:hypothetical protein SAMN05216374_0992 [Tardiphaga sp. OK246]